MLPSSDPRLGLSETFLDSVTQHASGSMSVYGVDMTALDARDLDIDALVSLTPISRPPASPSSTHERAESVFANFGASMSAGRVVEGQSINSFGNRGGSFKHLPTSPSVHFSGQNTAGLTLELSDVGKETTRTHSDVVRANEMKGSSGTANGSNVRHAASEDTTPHLAPTPGSLIGKSPVPVLNPLPAKPHDKQSSASVTSKTAFASANVAAAVAAGAGVTSASAAGVQRADTGYKGNKKRLPHVLSQTTSLRRASGDAQMISRKPKPSTPTRPVPARSNGSHENPDIVLSRSAPPDKDRSIRDAIRSTIRNRSEDRAGTLNSEEEKSDKVKQLRDRRTEKSRERELHPLASSYRKNNGSTFFSEFKTSSSKAADGLGKAGKGIFSKLTRSGSNNERVGQVPPADHVPTVLTLPLVEQTRITRIAKSYDHCKDKTEFWMPALPWRCIDFLNGRCEDEGLYRISGGYLQVKEWRKRFDTEFDVNLLDEPELYDTSIIASLFKEWIRELPEEIFPKPLQQRVAASLPGEEHGERPVPQALRDELSNLPPFNYYLLFAITCHLSLLLSNEEKNKMSLDNLYRCFNQSLKLDGRIFYTLVGDWRQCWQGCYTENEFLRAEYEYLNAPYPDGGETTDSKHIVQQTLPDDHAVSSSGSSRPSRDGRSTPDVQRPATSQATQPPPFAGESEDVVEKMRKKLNRSSSDVTGASPAKTWK